jgi:hypothetical protein
MDSGNRSLRERLPESIAYAPVWFRLCPVKEWSTGTGFPSSVNHPSTPHPYVLTDLCRYV